VAEGIAISRNTGRDQFGVVLRNCGDHCASYHIVAYVAGKGEKVTTNLRFAIFDWRLGIGEVVSV
jgi:hypothetical protein